MTRDHSFEQSVSDQPKVGEFVPVTDEKSVNEVDKPFFYERNLKIGTLNVCGLKKRLKYPEFVKLIEQYSILCVVETKIDESDIVNVPNYTFFRSQELKNSNGSLVELGFLYMTHTLKMLKY